MMRAGPLGPGSEGLAKDAAARGDPARSEEMPDDPTTGDVWAVSGRGRWGVGSDKVWLRRGALVLLPLEGRVMHRLSWRTH